MAIQKFQDRYALSKYYFDTARGVVMSTQSGAPKALTWSQARTWYPKRVSMVTSQGYKVNYTESQIKGMLQPVERDVETAAVTNDLSMLKPDFEYVLFSTTNRCSQYFFAGTSVKEALDRLAKRGEYVAQKDVRILNTRTGQVLMLKPQVITTYVLS
jgi:hypothetical protein